MKKVNLLWLLLLIPVLGLTLWLSGRSWKSDEPQGDPSALSGGTGKVHIHVKLGKPDSDIEQVKIVNAEDDRTMKERETAYRDKHVVHEYFAADGKTLLKRHTDYLDRHTLDEDFYTTATAAGTVKESIETQPGGLTTRSHCVYDEQGQLVNQEEFRPDQTVLLTRKRQTDGTVETRKFQKDGRRLASIEVVHPDQSTETSTFQDDGITLISYQLVKSDQTRETRLYRKDGKRLFSIEILRTDNSKETTYYRVDGKALWAIMSYEGYDLRAVQVFKTDGSPDHTRTFKSDGTLEVTVWGKAGPPPVAKFRQVWKNSSSYYWSRNYDQLSSIEKYRADGTTVEKLYEYDGGNLSKVTSNNTDGTKSVRYFRASNGTLEKEETYDAAGKVTKTENVEESKGVHEQIDAELTSQPTFQDPSSWGVSRD
jgi:hypothetical protein